MVRFSLPLAAAVAALGVARVGAWAGLPRMGDWTPLLRTFSSSASVTAYVDVYISPFVQLQEAERNPDVPAEVVQGCVNAAIDALHTAVTAFGLTQEQFTEQNKGAFRKAIAKAVDPIASPANDAVQPVFTKQALRDFAFQRFDDLIIASETYYDFTNGRRDLIQYISHIDRQMGRWGAEKFKTIFPRNVDLELVRTYTASVIDENRTNDDLSRGDLRLMRYRMYALGNSAARGVPLPGAALICSAIGALLATALCAHAGSWL